MPILMQLNAGQPKAGRPVKIYTGEVESSALAQLKNLAQLEIIYPHVAAMPDVHMGIGATVGSVIPTQKAIIPAAVGVDIGCGMNAVQLSLNASQLPDSLHALRSAIEQAIPVGPDAHPESKANLGRSQPLQAALNRLYEVHPALPKMLKKPHRGWVNQLGTLGGGNHFIEVCLDEMQNVWLMLHSGSRGIGNAIGRYFIKLAKKDMQSHLHHLPDKDLAYFEEGSRHFNDYLSAVEWAQHYAAENRREMMARLIRAIQPYLPPFKVIGEAINCHHNYVQKEHHFGRDLYITRKGAISARTDELGIIPGSMGARSYIVRGKGQADAFCSCAHGAGRRMSRTQAKRQFTRQDLEAQTEGVECRKDKQVVDEIPSAYKDIDEVMANQSDLVEVVHSLKQVVCVKG